MFGWFAKLFPFAVDRGLQRSRACRRKRRPDNRLRLKLEALEDRWAPAGDYMIHYQGFSFLSSDTEDAAALLILHSPLATTSPVATNDHATTNRNQAVSIAVLANDTDVGSTINPASVAIAHQPSNGTVSVDSSTGTVTYTPTTGFVGQDTFAYTVKDGYGDVSNQATVTVQVANVPPVATNDQATTNPNQPVTIAVLANDTDPGGTIDPTTVTIAQNPGDGTVSVNSSTGEVTYTPTTGFTGQDSFTYTVKDTNGAVSNVATVAISVNAPPAAANDQATTDRNQAVSINVLANDSDADGTINATSVTIVQNPSDGTVSVNSSTGQVTYTPTTGFVGQDTFTYTVKDNDGAVSNVATVTIQVVDAPPVAANDQALTNLNQAVTIAVLANDTDSDGTVDPTTVTIVHNPSDGTLSVNSTTGQVTYTPTTGFTGQDTFTYTVKDNDGVVSNVATVTITVNAPPVAANDQATTDRNQAATINVLANDTDSDGTINATTVTIVQNPTDGTVSVNPTTGQVTYTPATGFVGQDTFTYTVKDNDGAVSNVATVTIQVVDAPPVAANDQALTNLNQAVTIAVLANDTDTDGTVDPTTVTIVHNPSDGTVSVDPITGRVTYTPTTGFTGQDTFTYTVKDNDGVVSNVATVTITVNAPPVAANDQATTNRNQPQTINVLANDTDSDGTVNPTTVTIVQNPSDGTVSVSPSTGEVTYTPTAGFIGQDTFTYTVEDNRGAVSNAATVTVQVLDQPPVAANDQTTTLPNQAMTIAVLANDTDADGTVDPTTVAIVQNPSDGTASVDPVTGQVTYTPAPGFVGQDTFTYTVEDNDGVVSNVATVTVRVDTPPAIADQSFNVVDGSPINTVVGTVAASASHSGLTLTYALTGGNSGNTFQIDPATGRITVADNTLLVEGNGPFTLTVQVADNGTPALHNSATMTVNVIVGSVISAALANDTGSSATDGITTDPTVTGTVTHSDTLTSFIAGLDDANTADFIDVTNQLNNGAFTFDLNELTVINHGQTVADGVHTLRLQATNADGNVSPVFVLTFTLSRALPTFSMNLDPNFDTGTLGDQITSLSSVTLDGTTNPGNGVVLQDGQGNVLASTTANTGGNFSFTNVTLQNGANIFGIQVTTVSGVQTTFNRTFTRQDSPPTVLAPIANVSVPQNSASSSIDLAANFTDADMTDSIIQLNTSDGPIDVELFDTQAPQTVANFFNYIQSGAYDNAIFHRLVSGFVLQGGGFTFDASTHTLNTIPTLPAVANEFGVSNTAGTIAMAKLGSNANSATDEFFFNLADNSSNLNNQNGGFTVFGKILGAADQAVLNTLAATPVSSEASPFDSIPLNNYTGTNFPTDATAANFLTIQSVSIIKRTEFLTYSIVSNTNPGLVTPSLNPSANELLSLQYAAGQTGSATITIQATDRFGESVQSSFQVTVTA